MERGHPERRRWRAVCRAGGAGLANHPAGACGGPATRRGGYGRSPRQAADGTAGRQRDKGSRSLLRTYVFLNSSKSNSGPGAATRGTKDSTRAAVHRSSWIIVPGEVGGLGSPATPVERGEQPDRGRGRGSRGSHLQAGLGGGSRQQPAARRRTQEARGRRKLQPNSTRVLDCTSTEAEVSKAAYMYISQ
jgi:hypothetical protein